METQRANRVDDDKKQDNIWVDLGPVETLFPNDSETSSYVVDKETTPGWEGDEVAVWYLGSTSKEIFAIQNECPHKAGGKLSSGVAVKVPDIEDVVEGCTAAVACPVHTFTFSLNSGQCVSDRSKRTRYARIYRTKVLNKRLLLSRAEIESEVIDKYPEVSPEEGMKLMMLTFEQVSSQQL